MKGVIMKSVKPRKQIQVSLTYEEIEVIDLMAAKLGLSRSHMAGNLIQAGLMDLSVLKNLGVIGLFAKLQGTTETKILKELRAVKAAA